ncbi:MAG: type II toxin-antitoxin system YafQ family toxin [Bacilli bacterium]|nr:type II toxin-antitoxin system YafQ family toxin [Bacilli bacterium]
MKYTLKYSNRFKKQVKKMKKRGKDIEKLVNVIKILSNGDKLPQKYKNHILIGGEEFENCHECHIEPDWLLVYRIIDDVMVLLLVQTGAHSDIF